MTVTQPTAERAIDGDAHALFEEARRRRRRRRLLAAGFVVVTILVAGVVLHATGRGGSGAGRGSGLSVPGHRGGASGESSSASARGVTPVTLPAGDEFNAVTTEGRDLLLTGTRTSGRPSPPCVAALMDPRTLAIGRVVTGNCDDPALAGRTVMPVSSPSPNGHWTVAVAREDPATGAVTTGPVVMTYSDSSDTRPVTAYGDRSLWLYDVATTHGPEVLQISEATGRVTDTATAPPLYRPILAANDDGLWLGNSVEGGVSTDPLWHVAPGAASAVAVTGPPLSRRYDKPGVGFRTYDLDVIWLLGIGDHLWAGTALAGNIDQTIWRFDGPTARVVFSTPDHGYDPTGVVGDEADGLWTAVPFPPFGTGPVTPSENTRQDIVRIDPDTGAETVAAAAAPVPTLDAEEGMTAGQAAYLDGSLFVLQPPFRADGYLGYEVLDRVRT
jgi:hypothetical protein